MFDYEKARLPEIYTRNGKECYFDPVREKLIYVTPEETVRQKFISYLLDDIEVPIEMITVEYLLSKYNVKSKLRADIVINEINEKEEVIPVAVVECKSPDTNLDEKSMQQLKLYADSIGCKYAILTNGVTVCNYMYNEIENDYFMIEELPKYNQMLDSYGKFINRGELPHRIPFEQLENNIEYYLSTDISKDIEKNKQIAMLNLFECLLDTRVKIPCRQYKLFRVIEDYGVRMLSYGNAAGGRYFGPYRSFIIETNNNDTEIVSISIATWETYTEPSYEKTSINVAIDNEKNTHHSLQLTVNKNMNVNGDICTFTHNGKITVGNKGSGKIDELRQFVEKEYPELISDNRFLMGSLKNDRLWRLDDEEVISFVENLISYALIRDKYRDYIKNK